MQRWNKSPRVILFVVLLIGLLAGIFAPSFVNKNVKADALPGDIVISEFRTRGPNGVSDEFVELYNPKPYQVVVSGWQILGSNSSGVTSVRYIFPFDTVISAGQHYLIIRGGPNGYSGVVDGDATFIQDSLGFDDNGGIAISVDGTVIIDQVGMDAGSKYKEPPPPDGTGFLSPMSGFLDDSYERLLGAGQGSCTDSGINSADFVLIASNPQNTSSLYNYCPGSLPTQTPTFPPTIGTPPTNTKTPTPTRTPTRTQTPTKTAFPQLTIIINEVAWGGTNASASDQWIELYNPTDQDISLVGWNLYTDDRRVDITWSASDTQSTTIGRKSYYLIENRIDDNAVSDVPCDKCTSFTLLRFNQVLRLVDSSTPVKKLIDYANGDGGQWPAGNDSTGLRNTMERFGILSNGTEVWLSNNGINRNGADFSGNPINGTPRQPNWANTITLTPSNTPVPFVPTKRPRLTPTLVPTPRPVGRPFINEFLPRPGFDWNLDGKVDVFDEFIELKNVGNADMDLSGWSLDDEADFPGAVSSSPYTIQSLILKPGEYALFYASETNILLSDGGDSVRLFDASGKILDVIDYSIAKVEDESVCRFPDGNGFGSWFNDCTPTPNLTNTREGSVPNGNSQSPVCNLPDTLPADFLFAECRGYGANIWNEFYWNEFGWQGDQNVPDNLSKWKSFVE